MSAITFKQITKGDIELCRDLCNELMAFQKSKATISPESFDDMNFDTRMKWSINQAEQAQVVVVLDGKIPVGYIFSTIDSVADHKTVVFPDWTPKGDRTSFKGFYPDWDTFPAQIGCLNNLYLRDDYRAMKLGSKLFNEAIVWFNHFSEIDLIFTFVSNGNDEALDFYLRNGFVYSHDVFGGFIKALYYRK